MLAKHDKRQRNLKKVSKTNLGWADQHIDDSRCEQQVTLTIAIDALADMMGTLQSAWAQKIEK